MTNKRIIVRDLPFYEQNSVSADITLCRFCELASVTVTSLHQFGSTYGTELDDSFCDFCEIDSQYFAELQIPKNVGEVSNDLCDFCVCAEASNFGLDFLVVETPPLRRYYCKQKFVQDAQIDFQTNTPLLLVNYCRADLLDYYDFI